MTSPPSRTAGFGRVTPFDTVDRGPSALVGHAVSGNSVDDPGTCDQVTNIPANVQLY